VGFNGQEGIRGLVTQDWVGIIQLSSLESRPIPLPGSFGITRLGSIDAIFGLPWLDCQGWVASGSVKSGHQFTLGSTTLCLMESLWPGGKPGGKVVPPVILPPSPLSLPLEFEQFGNVFSPQTNCALPPHRGMDISINLKEGSVPPPLGACTIFL
jgi:hypothetical protein